MELGKILEEERIKKGISRRRLAEMAGVTNRAIIYWENGEKSMSIESADKVFKVLGISVTIGKE